MTKQPRLAVYLLSLLFFTFVSVVGVQAQIYPPADLPAVPPATIPLVQSLQGLAADNPTIARLLEEIDELDFADAPPEELQRVVDELLDELRAAFPDLDIQAASVMLVTVNPDGTLSREVPAQVLVKDPETGEVAVLTLGSGYAPGSRVTLTIESEPVTLGEVDVTDGGKFFAVAEVPASMPTGRHMMKASGTDPDGESRVLGQPVQLEASPPRAEPTTAADDSRSKLAAGADFSAPAKSGSTSWSLPLLIGLSVAAMGGAGAYLLRRKPAAES